MEIYGKIINVLPLEQGVSKSGKEWKQQHYILETQEQYSRKVCIEVFGEERINNNLCEIGDMVTVSFDIESREYNGRWFTSIRAWKIVEGTKSNEINPAKEEKAQVEAQNTANVVSEPVEDVTNNDLPF